jgi:hypothetical protein
VYDRSGERLGVVDRVVTDRDDRIFEGVIIHTVPLPGRHVRAMPDQIAELHRNGVLLKVDRDALADESSWRHRDRGDAPAPEPPLERFARRVLDRFGGRR